MKKYTAVVRNRDFNSRITSTGADSLVEADEELSRQLCKRGREGYLKAWVDGGRLVIIDDDDASLTSVAIEEAKQAYTEIKDRLNALVILDLEDAELVALLRTLRSIPVLSDSRIKTLCAINIALMDEDGKSGTSWG